MSAGPVSVTCCGAPCIVGDHVTSGSTCSAPYDVKWSCDFVAVRRTLKSGLTKEDIDSLNETYSKLQQAT